ncbi:unnamed protein product [Cuscuta epithymum]|uniref:Auxin-responsive protein n=1 Tax=Cuscuta epithymum TaxID=186058 RepID=A0AAV0F6P5_9ASTE|nr:unnamed protein product [Cuscuta epithymum]
MEPAHGLIGGGRLVNNEAELELGLSLGSGGVGNIKKLSKCGGRILTAKDFPNGFPSGFRAVSGAKRAADSYAASSPPSASSHVVGWPPIKACRMNSLANTNNQPKVPSDEQQDGVVSESKQKTKRKVKHGNCKDGSPRCLGFVKVNMDGIPIGRKVDLNAHTSYKTLAHNLEDMFFKSTTKTMSHIWSRGKQQKVVHTKLLDLDGSSEFVLTYEDKDGDWMLVGDVPWGMFLSTVKRLRIMRTSEANGLAPIVQERHGRHKGKPT